MYTKNPDIEVLVNNSDITVVREKMLEITAYVFWSAGTYGDIQCSSPCVLLVNDEHIYIADPTQSVGMIELSIGKDVYMAEHLENGETLILDR